MLGTFGIKIMSENQLLNGYANSIGYNGSWLTEGRIFKRLVCAPFG
jgi:hypothetical protein